MKNKHNTSNTNQIRKEVKHDQTPINQIHSSNSKTIVTMKNLFNTSAETYLRLLIIAILLVILPACDPPRVDPDTSRNLGNQITKESFNIGPDGGTIKALDGNVTIEIPQGALFVTEKFTIEEGPRDDGNDFIIKSIIIKPKAVAF